MENVDTDISMQRVKKKKQVNSLNYNHENKGNDPQPEKL